MYSYWISETSGPMPVAGSSSQALNSVRLFSVTPPIQKFISYLNDDFETMSDRTEAMIDLAKDYTSYSGIADNMTGITQFVIKTDGI